MSNNSTNPSSHRSSTFNARSRTPNPFQNEAESSTSGAARSFVPESPFRPFNDFRDDPSQVDAAMRDTEEDHSWMQEMSPSDDEYETLKTLHTSLSKKDKSGNISAGERMELYKLERTLQMKARLRAAAMQRAAVADEDEDEDGGLFVREEVVDRHRRNRPTRTGGEVSEDEEMMDGGEGEVDGEDETMLKMLQQELNGDGLDGPGTGDVELGFTKSGKPRKRRAKNAREVVEREEETRRLKERSKAQKKKGLAGTRTTKGRKPAKGKGKEKEKEKKKGKGKKGTVKNGESLLRSGKFNLYSGTDDVGQMMLEDLMTNDPISDRLQNPIFNVEPEAPMPGQHRKESQFQMLFANIPTGDGSKANAKDVNNDKKALKEASRSFGYAQVKALDGKWLIKGMKSTLYHHQLLGAQWMVQRELSSQPPHGGLLADSMGLGKTVQTLACMVGNPPGPEDIKRKVKTTLIVVPATVIDQWLDEIRIHAKRDTFPKIMRYKSSSRIPMEVLEDLDIVVTSYSEVMKQFPFPDKEGREKIARIGYQKWWKTAMYELGDLHCVNWYRVVLDEAQAIKNNSARTSLACQNLKSVYRWCLTGTPLLNRLEELFPYLRFLKANCSMDWQTFQKYFCDPDAPDSYNRIGTLLSYTMMRRTMKTTILNRPIVTLPPPHPEIQYISFSAEEQLIYRITENRFRANLNAFFKRSEAQRNYCMFMVQLLRLRQCTSHPFMLERTIKETWTLEDVAELKAKLSRLRRDPNSNRPFYEQCQVWVEDATARREAARRAAEERGEEYVEGMEMGVGEDSEEMPFGQGNFGHRFSMQEALKTLSEKELFKRVLCSACADVPDKPMRTDCGHIFCNDCITSYIHGRTAESGVEEDILSCPACDRIFQHIVPVNPSSDPMAFSPSSRSRTGTPGAGKPKKFKETHKGTKGKDATGFEPHTSHSEWLEMSDLHPEKFPLTASAKTTALKALLLRGFMEAPYDKVVIYVQFRQLARIVGRICQSEGWQFLYLTGDRALEDRSKVIARFRDDKSVKILIAGLKCGGLGLNFPWANRCISLDLWWNHAVEQQAFGRIFRIGQKKDTYMTRIVVKNTVDMRLLTMQLHKLTHLEKAIKEDDANSGVGRRGGKVLGLRELANLFGFLREDGDGVILSVEADYDDDENGVEAEEAVEDARFLS
ncbi:hypothetical protein L207DRAFT_435119 [Hyaloscypha variabilis F]|uniref:Uncharacterized protein n=1 Tax=Hyaloscypha variabilis (strain UAMH 11265 / GT02V1 / F) TaxID=1149755 RepID=A0A2J6RCT2_HYAVF|nr:hypothetical protein L207DRAFT_435119 [Hyaloscypha variabilis F]